MSIAHSFSDPLSHESKRHQPEPEPESESDPEHETTDWSPRFASRPLHEEGRRLVDSALQTQLCKQWRLDIHGAPVLEPIALTRDHLILLGKGIDSATLSGGYQYYTVFYPAQTRRCQLLSWTDVGALSSTSRGAMRGSRISCLLMDGKLVQIDEEDTPQMVESWFDGMSMLDCFYDDSTRALLIHDVLMFRGRHVHRQFGYGDRHALLLHTPLSPIPVPRPGLTDRPRPMSSCFSSCSLDPRYSSSSSSSSTSSPTLSYSSSAPGSSSAYSLSSTSSSSSSAFSSSPLGPSSMSRKQPLTESQKHTRGRLTLQLAAVSIYPAFPSIDEHQKGIYWLRPHSDYSTNAVLWGTSSPSFFFHVPQTRSGYLFCLEIRRSLTSEKRGDYDLLASVTMNGDVSSSSSSSSSSTIESSEMSGGGKAIAKDREKRARRETVATIRVRDPSRVPSVPDDPRLVHCQWDAVTKMWHILGECHEHTYPMDVDVVRHTQAACSDPILHGDIMKLHDRLRAVQTLLEGSGRDETQIPDEWLEELVDMCPALAAPLFSVSKSR